MPKIIKNAREEILKEAKRQLLENGYGATTIRSVAKATGIATGTVYNGYVARFFYDGRLERGTFLSYL